jgi:hypothetical protein
MNSEKPSVNIDNISNPLMIISLVSKTLNSNKLYTESKEFQSKASKIFDINDLVKLTKNYVNLV